MQAAHTSNPHVHQRSSVSQVRAKLNAIKKKEREAKKLVRSGGVGGARAHLGQGGSREDRTGTKRAREEYVAENATNNVWNH